METKMFYDAPRSISIGDIFYVIDTRERNDFSSPCRVCNDEKKLTVNGITFDCPVCGGYRPRETVVSVQHFTVATVKVCVIKQEVSTDYWTIQNYRDLHFRVFRKRGHGYNGDGNNFTRDFTSNNIKNNLNVLPDEKFLQIYSQDGYFARNCERFIFDDYKLACRAADNPPPRERSRNAPVGVIKTYITSPSKYRATSPSVYLRPPRYAN